MKLNVYPKSNLCPVDVLPSFTESYCQMFVAISPRILEALACERYNPMSWIIILANDIRRKWDKMLVIQCQQNLSTFNDASKINIKAIDLACSHASDFLNLSDE